MKKTAKKEIQSSIKIKKYSDKQVNTKVYYNFTDGYFKDSSVGEQIPKNSYSISNQSDGANNKTRDNNKW